MINDEENSIPPILGRFGSEGKWLPLKLNKEFIDEARKSFSREIERHILKNYPTRIFCSLPYGAGFSILTSNFRGYLYLGKKRFMFSKRKRQDKKFKKNLKYYINTKKFISNDSRLIISSTSA